VRGQTPGVDVPPERLTASTEGDVESRRPWVLGYATARLYRERLSVEAVAALDPMTLLTVRRTNAPTAGLEGLVASGAGGRGAVLPSALSARAGRFAAARGLGLTLLQPDRSQLLLDPTPTTLTKASRAFAAELLAPAEGIRRYLQHLGAPTPAAFDAIAERYRVDSRLVQHQYENQLAGI